MSTLVDLSELPAPEVLEPLDFEVVYDEALGVFRGHMGDNWTAAVKATRSPNCWRSAATSSSAIGHGSMMRPKRNCWPMPRVAIWITWRPTLT